MNSWAAAKYSAAPSMLARVTSGALFTQLGGAWLLLVLQVGQQSVVDLSSEEEPCATATLRIAVNAGGRVMGISKAGGGGIDPTLTQVRRGCRDAAGLQGAGPRLLHACGLSCSEPYGCARAGHNQVCSRADRLLCLPLCLCLCRRWWRWRRSWGQGS